MMKRISIYILLFFVSLTCIEAQELNAKITINRKVQWSNIEVFSSMENDLSQFLNERKWTDLTFNRSERIDCNITITINQVIDEKTFSADIQVTSRRPVYNSAYITPLINFRDSRFEFPYIQGQSLNFNYMNVDNNLVATIVFYAYVIIGFDFDSFSLNGGRPYFDKAMEIANTAQSLKTIGWEPFSGNNNRYDLAIALTEESSKSFHSLWYNYHRMGLDEMAANPARGRIRILESMNDLQKLYEARPSSVLLQIFAEAKLDEVIRIASQATQEEKQALKKLLLQIYPTRSSAINVLQ